jgi:hypothetical protein
MMVTLVPFKDGGNDGIEEKQEWQRYLNWLSQAAPRCVDINPVWWLMGTMKSLKLVCH